MAKTGGFFFIIFGVIVLIAALFTINPIWNYGPYDPSPVSAGTQPDWYIGFADGALRLVPPDWEFVSARHTWSFNILIPLVGLGAVHRRSSRSTRSSRRGSPATSASTTSLDRPRNAATRTAIGAAGVTFYAVLWAAASLRHHRHALQAVRWRA